MSRVFSRLSQTLWRSASHNNNHKRVLFGCATGVLGSSVWMLSSTVNAAAHEDRDYYLKVRKAIVESLEDDSYDDGSYGPVYVRLGWHLSGTYDNKTKTGGSDGGTMRHAAEAAHGANAGLAVARERLAAIHLMFPEMSYGDLWTFASVVAIEEMGGPAIDWSPGRRDAPADEVPPEGRLPDASQGAQHLKDIFYKMDMNDQEIVALAGAHALGRCHTDRSGFDGPWTFAPTTFSNDYFVRLLEDDWDVKRWNGPKQYEDRNTKQLMMLPADLSLRDAPEFRKWVEIYAKDEERFFKDFSKAYNKLTELGCRNLNKELVINKTNLESGGSWNMAFALAALNFVLYSWK